MIPVASVGGHSERKRRSKQVATTICNRPPKRGEDIKSNGSNRGGKAGSKSTKDGKKSKEQKSVKMCTRRDSDEVRNGKRTAVTIRENGGGG